MYCKKCGRKLSENAKFCPTCGDIISKNAQPTHNYSVPNPNQVNNFNVPNHNYNAPNPHPVSAPKPMPKSSEKKSSNKGLLIVIMSLLVVISITLGVVLAMLIGIKGEEKKQTVDLNEWNFYEYFTYDISSVRDCGSSYVSSNYGKIIITFYPLKNFEIENGSFSVFINSTDSDVSIYGSAGKSRTVKIPFDGKFSITFSDYVYFYNQTDVNHNNIVLNLSNVSGTIILK